MDKPLHHFDKRIVRRSIKKGILSEEEAASQVAALADQSGNIMPAEGESPAEELAPVVSSEPERVDSAEGVA
jgi:hypothetical protein